MTKIWTLTIKNSPPCTLTLAPPNQRGICSKCRLEKEIKVLSDRFLDYRQFCQACSLLNLEELEESDYEVEIKNNNSLKEQNKNQIIQELRNQLNNHV